MKSLLRECRDFCRFFWGTPECDKRIVFYAEHEGYYPNFEGLLSDIRTHASVCYVTSDPKDPVLGSRDARLRVFYLRRLLTFFFLFVSCRVFVMTMTDLNRFHLKRSVRPVHYAYVFHSMVSTHMAYLEGAFDHYDSVLCVGPHHVREIRKREDDLRLPAKILVEAGYYRLERIHRRYVQEQGMGDGGKKTVLIAPSWGPQNILESCGEDLVNLLLSAGYRVVVRPHPETVQRDPALLERLGGRFGGRPDFLLERSVRSDDSLIRADVLVCDCSGIALEYAFGTERPVLFLDVPCKVRNPRHGDLGLPAWEMALRPRLGKIVSAKELEKIPAEIEALTHQKEAFAAGIRALRREAVFAFGRSAETGARHILNLAKTAEEPQVHARAH